MFSKLINNTIGTISQLAVAMREDERGEGVSGAVFMVGAVVLVIGLLALIVSPARTLITDQIAKWTMP
jgi:hypothetical protein